MLSFPRTAAGTWSVKINSPQTMEKHNAQYEKNGEPAATTQARNTVTTH